LSKDPYNYDYRQKRQTGGNPEERRRRALIRHDDRGNATVEWVDIPENERDQERVPLSVADEPGATGIRQRRPEKRTDLRKLSEWIKAQKLAEQNKKSVDDDN
jgi:hypothetical protein